MAKVEWRTEGVTDMFSLATIQRLNNAVELRKAKRRARALNAKNKKSPVLKLTRGP